jgi:hypothetical protein
MKRILINEHQEQFILEAMRHNDALSNLPKHLLDDLKHPFNNISISDCEFLYSPLMKHYLEQVVIKRYKHVCDYFLDDINNINKEDLSNKIDKLMKKCIEKERPIRAQLEQLCYNTLVDLFNIPEDSFSYECHLVDGIDDNLTIPVHSEPINYFDDMVEAESLSNEIQKRRFVNMLCVGGSVVLADKAKELFLHKVFELDEELPHLYSRILKLNELYLFISRIKIRDGFLQQGGYVEVTLPTEEKIANIKVNAMIFPILLCESIKGIMELSSSYGLPDNQDIANEIMKISDALEYEPWDMRLGPEIFNSIFSKIINIDSVEIPFILKGLSEENYETFFNLIKECLLNTEKSKEVINHYVTKYLHDKEYGDFEQDLMTKQNNNLLLNGCNY